MFGWLVSLAIVVTVTVLATGNNPPKPNTAPSLADAGGEDRYRRRPCRDRDPAAPQDGAAEEAEEAAEVAGARGQHVPVVRHGPCAALQPGF